MSVTFEPVKRNGLKLLVIVIALAGLAAVVFSSRAYRVERVEASTITTDMLATMPDPEKAKAAFNDAVKVFFSARCANCHPAGDIPTQGDEMTPHTMGVTRGKDGGGVYGMRCDTCHQRENLAGEHMPPGTSKPWHLPPSSQPMVFQGLTPGELCQNFNNPAKNGGRRNPQQVIDHILKKDPLVMWAWNPGNGRTLPPMTFEDFSAMLQIWVDNGAACPE